MVWHSDAPFLVHVPTTAPPPQFSAQFQDVFIMVVMVVIYFIIVQTFALGIIRSPNRKLRDAVSGGFK